MMSPGHVLIERDIGMRDDEDGERCLLGSGGIFGNNASVLVHELQDTLLTPRSLLVGFFLCVESLLESVLGLLARCAQTLPQLDEGGLRRLDVAGVFHEQRYDAQLGAEGVADEVRHGLELGAEAAVHVTAGVAGNEDRVTSPDEIDHVTHEDFGCEAGLIHRARDTGIDDGLVGLVADDDRLAERFEEGLPQHTVAILQEGARNADDMYVGQVGIG